MGAADTSGYKKMGFAGVLVRNYEELALAKETFWGSEIITDHNLYCYNDQAVRAFAGQGVTKIRFRWN